MQSLTERKRSRIADDKWPLPRCQVAKVLREGPVREDGQAGEHGTARAAPRSPSTQSDANADLNLPKTGDIILYDNRIVLYKMESDVMMYVVGDVSENEVLLYNVILALRDSLHLIFKYVQSRLFRYTMC